jgi:Zn ribbon nucleic-acid-binding protein
MMRRLLRPCPRCRGTHLLELKEDGRHVVRCVACGYYLQQREIRFLNEDAAPAFSAEKARVAPVGVRR